MLRCSNNKKTKTNYFQIFLVIVVYCSQHNTHEDVQTNDDVHHKKQGKPTTPVVCWHPETWSITVNILYGNTWQQ